MQDGLLECHFAPMSKDLEVKGLYGAAWLTPGAIHALALAKLRKNCIGSEEIAMNEPKYTTLRTRTGSVRFKMTLRIRNRLTALVNRERF